MTRPSEPVLRWLRQQVDARGQNTASLAKRLERPRKEVRELLTGSAPMTLDDLVRITEALELSPQDLAMGGAVGVPEAEEGPEPAQFGNQPEALFRLGFDLGIDMVFVTDTAKLGDWGGPDEVLRTYRGKDLTIRLDAAYHGFMDPSFDAAGLTLTLSFDKLYRCTIPWWSVKQLVFTPLPPEAPEEEPPPPDDGETKGPPRLRLVT